MGIIDKRGFVFSTDLLVAMGIFILVFAALQIGYANMVERIRQEQKNLFYEDVLATMDHLLIYPGFPRDWDKENVVSPGLADKPNILNRTKVDRFIALDYDKAKDLLGLRGVDFYFDIRYGNGTTITSDGFLRPPVGYIARQTVDTSFLSVLNNSNIVWDLYWTGGPVPSNTARHVYEGAANDLMEWLIENGTNSPYNTIIYEDIHVKWNDISTGHQDLLRDWVNSSGTYIHSQHEEDFLEIFGITVADENKKVGIVHEEDPLLNASKGDVLTFEQEADVFDSASSPYPLKFIVNDSSDLSRCLVCKWTYADGTIYYMPDGNLDGGTLAISTKGLFYINYTKGAFPKSTEENIFIASRDAVMNGEIVEVRLIVW